jgi:hypothetical protein
MRSYLVVANLTLGGAHLVSVVRERMRAGDILPGDSTLEV